MNILQRVLGTPELHTHIRLKPLTLFFNDYIQKSSNKTIVVVEPGCGNGINAFELAKITKRYNKKMRYLGIDLDEHNIEIARSVSDCAGLNALFEFHKANAIEFLEKKDDVTADIILLMDIIEHVDDARKLLEAANTRLRKDGLMIVSVPTPLYPKIFGRKFHEHIGHRIKGYTIEDLDRLFAKERYRRLICRYNTGLICNMGCWLYYNLFDIRNRSINILKFIVFYPFIFLDIYNSPKVSCTLFAAYKKSSYG